MIARIIRLIPRRGLGLVAFLIAIPGAASAQEAGRPPISAPKPKISRKFFDVSSWVKRKSNEAPPVVAGLDRPPAETPGMVPRDAGVRRVAQEPTLPDLSTPASERNVGGGSPNSDSAGQPSTPSADAANAADAAAPDGAAGSSTPASPDLKVPASDRGTGGGEPTTESAQAEGSEPSPGDENAPRHLQDLLGYGESPIKVYGWLQNSYTGNANGRGITGNNFGVNPNRKANWWMGNQYYAIIEKTVEQNDTVNFGFRMDNLFGNDWQFNYMQGFFNNAFPLDSFAGYDIPQLYGEVHLPILTDGGLDVKAGKFYTIAGYEQVPAIARPLLSTPYMFAYGQPFQHIGALTTLHLTPKINLYNGAINGWDRFINERYVWGYIGGFSWVSEDDKTTLAMTAIWGPNQFPSFLPNNQQIYPGGYVNIPSLAGLRNPGYWRNDRTLFTWVGTHKWNDKFTQVVETDQGWERSIPGLGSGGENGAPRDATWFSFGNWFLYEFDPKLTGVWRSEVFWDPQGARTQKMVNGQFVGDRFYEMTIGAIYKPHPNLWIRPEARYDWSQYHPAYTDDTRKSQLTLAVDAIILW